MAPAEDEPESVTDLHTHIDFVVRIQIFESDCVDALADGFKAAVNQLFVLNPRLNTEGIGGPIPGGR